MGRKPRFKVQRRNCGDAADLRRQGNKRWLNCYDHDGSQGYTMTFEDASALHRRLSGWYPDETYRIKEKP